MICLFFNSFPWNQPANHRISFPPTRLPGYQSCRMTVPRQFLVTLLGWYSQWITVPLSMVVGELQLGDKSHFLITCTLGFILLNFRCSNDSMMIVGVLIMPNNLSNKDRHIGQISKINKTHLERCFSSWFLHQQYPHGVWLHESDQVGLPWPKTTSCVTTIWIWHLDCLER